MSYRLSITKIIPNPNYDAEEEREKQERMNRWTGNNEIFAPATYEDKALTVEITDEEFKAIKKAVLEVM